MSLDELVYKHRALCFPAAMKSHTPTVLDENSEKAEAEIFAVDGYEKGTGFVYFRGRGVELAERGWFILDGFVDDSELT